MLTTDLIRARIRNKEIRPSYIDTKDHEWIELASTLVDLFRTHVGRRRGDLDECIADLAGEQTDYLVHRGLAKLLYDRSTYEVSSPCDPIVLREKVFARSAAAHPVAQHAGDHVHKVTRNDVLLAVAQELNVSVAEVERGLYADLEREQRMEAFEAISPGDLLAKYNVALAQAVLLRATKLTVRIAPGLPTRFRQLFRFIKFFRLMHTVEGNSTEGYTLTLDGPLSMFQFSNKYGLQMAEFLPALLLCDGWELQADVVWGKERKPAVFHLDPSHGLQSHYRDTGTWETDEEKFFRERFTQTSKDWLLEQRPEIVDLGGRGVLIPDFVLRHKTDGREVLLEIVGFWRKNSLLARMELLRTFGPPNLLLAVSKRLEASREQIESLPGEVVFFREIIPTKEILEKASLVARAPKEATRETATENASPVAKRTTRRRKTPSRETPTS